MKIACTDDNRYLVDNKSWTDEVVRHGLSYMEFAMSKLPENEADMDEVITYALSQGVKLNLHSPYGINNIASTDSARRASSIANLKRTIDVAAKYNLGAVAFHPGRLSDENDNPEEIWASMMDVVSDIAQYAKEKKVFVGIENMELRPYELVYTIEDLNRFAPFAENNPYFGVTIDFAHYASLGIGFPDLSALKLPIYDVHVSQIVNGVMHSGFIGPDCEPDIDEVCRLLADYGYDGLIVLETRERIWESAKMLRTAFKALNCE